MFPPYPTPYSVALRVKFNLFGLALTPLCLPCALLLACSFSHSEHLLFAGTFLNTLCSFQAIYTASLSSSEDPSPLVTPASPSKLNSNITSSRKPSGIPQSDSDALSFELPSSPILPPIAALKSCYVSFLSPVLGFLEKRN